MADPDRPTYAVEAAADFMEDWLCRIHGVVSSARPGGGDGEAARLLDAYEQALAATPEGKRYLLGLVLSEDALKCLVADLREMDHGCERPTCELCSLVSLLSPSTEREEAPDG